MEIVFAHTHTHTLTLTPTLTTPTPPPHTHSLTRKITPTPTPTPTHIHLHPHPHSPTRIQISAQYALVVWLRVRALRWEGEDKGLLEEDGEEGAMLGAESDGEGAWGPTWEENEGY